MVIAVFQKIVDYTKSLRITSREIGAKINPYKLIRLIGIINHILRTWLKYGFKIRIDNFI